MAKVNKERRRELIRIKLSSILQKSASNPNFEGITITDVKVSPDSSVAIVYYSIFNTSKSISHITRSLNDASGFFQSKLSNSLKTRNTPRLKFIYDSGFDKTDKIETILKSLNTPPE
ncbi:MAG: 30S ribosome-binding factor RbfA [Deltaproteobacteria bacterium]|jgi:ribosome-binding factor A|nr:30S ribosome-binding factor RbfA [Deltaproteobacteria bacterium]MBT4524959.1 30S ribosome-binding factor RbfA [Deltaproteobacteria bacterium]